MLGAHFPDQVRMEEGVVGISGVETRRPDDVIARLATAQDGMVGRRQLLEAGVTHDAIRHRVTARRLHRYFRGVYAVGHTAVSLRGRARGALLSYGDDAVLSHLWAAAVYGIRRGPPAAVDVTVPGAARDRQAGVSLHRARDLDAHDVALGQGLPVTSIPRLLLDLADVLPPREVERALDEAIGRRLTTPGNVRALAARSPGRRGLPLLDELLERDYTARTRSEFEERMLALIREARLPHPQVNAEFGPFEVDFLWPQARYAIEADSLSWHLTPERQRRDRRKDRYLAECGIRLRRVRWQELAEERLALAAEVAAALAAGAADPVRARSPA